MHRTAFSRALAVLAFALAMIAMAGPVRADARTEARAHYAAGKDLFAGGNFRGAIAEFARADALAPSPILQFNIALCYEKLGDDAEALRRYRLYLDKMPSAPNRAAVEAKISAIEAHVAAAKPAPPPPVAAAEAAPPPPVAAAEAAPPPPVAPAEAAPPSLILGNAVPAAGADAAPAKEATVGGDTAAATPRDPGLARVAQINVAQVRDARRAAGFVIAPAPTPSREPGASSGYSAPIGADDSGDDDPIYTKWWFWGIAAVGAFIVYKFATADNDRGDAIAGPPPPASIRQPVLFRF